MKGSITYVWLGLLTLLFGSCDRSDRFPEYIARHPKQFYQANQVLNAAKYDEAISIYTEILSVDPENAAAYARRGQAYYKSGQDAQALTDYNQAIELYPHNAKVYAWRGLAYAFLQQPQQALQDFQTALKVDPEEAEAYWGLGHTYYFLAQYQQAITHYSQAILLNPEYARAYAGRGTAYKQLGDYQQALADYDAALAFALEEEEGSREQRLIADIYNNRAATYDSLGHYDQAIADFTKAIELNPDFALGYANLGLAYLNMWNVQDAEKQCQTSLQLEPNNCAAQYCLGLVYTQLAGEENYKKAIEHFTAIPGLNCGYYVDDRDVANVYVNLGIVKSLLGYPSEEILAAYQEAVQRNPQHPYVYFLMGEQHEGENAIADYTKAIELTPEYAVAYLKRGMLYKQQGKYQDALADFTSAQDLALDGQWRQAAEEQARLLTSTIAPDRPEVEPAFVTPDTEPLRLSPQQVQEEFP